MPERLNPVVSPPAPKLLDYPAATSVFFGVVATAVLLLIINKFDQTGGTLAISLMVIFTFVSVLSVSLFFTIPNDEITSAVVGGLIAAFASVITFWLGKRNG